MAKGEPPSGVTGKRCIHIGVLQYANTLRSSRAIRSKSARDSSEVDPATENHLRLSGTMRTVIAQRVLYVSWPPSVSFMGVAILCGVVPGAILQSSIETFGSSFIYHYEW